MQVINKTMYHIHKSNEYDNIWQPKNKLIIDNNFHGYADRIISEFNTFAPLTNEENLDTTIYNYLQNKYLDQKELVRLLIEARAKIYSSNILKREVALEEIRQELFPHLPSRKHSLFVTTKRGINFWKQSLVPSKNSHKLAVFELSLTGNLFRSNASLLPQPETTYNEAKQMALYYWDPDLRKTNSSKDEYLFQGQARIVKKL